MDIQARSLEDVELISVDGEIDMFVSPMVREALLKAIGKSPRAILFNLARVPYMDSSGIATLVEGLQWSKRHNGRFMLTGVQSSVLNTLKLAKLHELFEIHANEEDALRSLPPH